MSSITSKVGSDISVAQKFLERGELVAIPTETVYGLAANALNVEAVSKVFAAKNRPAFDPLIIHTNSIEKVKIWTTEFPDWAEKLAKHFWTGAMTLLLPKSKQVPDLVTNGLPRVAVRLPNHPLTLKLLERLSFPLAAPSANPFGYISATQPSHVAEQLGEKVSYILDGGRAEIGIESTIIGEEKGKLIIYRKGGIAVEEIEKVVGKVIVKEHSNSNPSALPDAPGMLSTHYAPKVKLQLGNISQLLKETSYSNDRIGVLSFFQSYEQVLQKNQFVLSKTKDELEAAQNLFDFLRQLDQLDIDIIYAELLPESGLGRAINDRLRRASI